MGEMLEIGRGCGWSLGMYDNEVYFSFCWNRGQLGWFGWKGKQKIGEHASDLSGYEPIH